MTPEERSAPSGTSPEDEPGTSTSSPPEEGAAASTTTADEGGPARAARRHRVEWWHRLRPMTRRGIRAGLAMLVTGLVALGVGVPSAHYTGSLGPHEAEYTVRLNDEIRIDMGPLGAIIIDSPLPLRLGVDVQVKEIPIGLAAPGANPIAGLTADLQSYTQFFANPEPAIREAADGLITNALGRVTLLWSIQLLLVACLRLAGHGLLRETVKDALRRPGVPPLTIAVVVALVLVPLVDATRGSGNVGRTSDVLAGTPLQDARITGRLATIVDYYGGYVVDAIDENSEFYASVQANLTSAFEAERAALDSSDAAQDGAEEETDGHGLASPESETTGTDVRGGENPTSAASASADETPTGEPTADGEATPSAEDAAVAEAETDLITGVMVTDLHCNIGMADVIGTAVTGSDADLVINAGDTVMAGTSVESYCVKAFADGFGDVPVVFSDGNHDSRSTTEEEVAAGWIPLLGEPVEVAGLRFLGDTDPTLSSLGVPTRQTRDETVQQMGDRLAQAGCALAEEDQQVDVLLIHSPYAARQILQAGCAPMSLSGHLHRQLGPRQLGWGTQYIGASTGGAGSGTPTIGPLNNPATITVIRWNADTHLPVDYRVITVGTDTSVVLGDWAQWPPQPEEFVPDPGLEE